AGREAGQSLGRCRPAASSPPAPCATSRDRSSLLQALQLLARALVVIAQRRHARAVAKLDQYLIEPAILRTMERGAKRVLTAPILLTRPGTTTALFLSRPLRP